MRFSTLVASFVAGLAFTTASPIDKKDVVEVVDVVYECPKIKPKVFIISMVNQFLIRTPIKPTKTFPNSFFMKQISGTITC